MCEYCERGRRIETEVDGMGYLLVYEPDPEHGIEGFAVDVYQNYLTEDDGEYVLTFSVPRCPMCGSRPGNREACQKHAKRQGRAPLDGWDELPVREKVRRFFRQGACK